MRVSSLEQQEMNSRQQFNSCEEQQEHGVGHFFSGFPDLNPVFSSTLEQQQLQMAELNAIVSSPRRSLSSIMGNSGLSGLVQKIGQLQMLVQLVGEGRNGNQQQHLATAAGIGRLIDQLLVAAKGILVEQQQQQQVVQHHHLLSSSNQLSSAAAGGLFQEGVLEACSGNNNNHSSSSYDFIGDDMGSFQQMPFHGILPKTEDDEQLPWMPIIAAAATAQKHEDAGDDDAADNLPHGAYDLIELDAMEIMAEHTHFCEICGKGFKRDANLRMHMRGHGDEYKTAAALARPKEDQQQQQQQMAAPPKRYSCPYGGCKRNKQHRKFVPLKTMLCVKNHYRRSHCPKRLACTKCRVKRFAVLADLKTHEKHCGREKWQCSCGTTFSRKDKLLGHVALFVGHKPLVMLVPPSPPPPVFLGESTAAAAAAAYAQKGHTAYAQNGHLDMKLPNAFLAQQEVTYYMGNFHAAAVGGNINSSTVMLGGSQLSSGTGSSSALTTTEVGATVESCWSPSIFTSPPTANNNSNNSNNNLQQQQESSNKNSSSLGSLVGLDFFDCKS